MTLETAFAHFAAHLHSKTLRPFKRFAVVNAANSNNRTATLSRACAAEAGFDPRPASNPSAGDA